MWCLPSKSSLEFQESNKVLTLSTRVCTQRTSEIQLLAFLFLSASVLLMYMWMQQKPYRAALIY